MFVRIKTKALAIFVVVFVIASLMFPVVSAKVVHVFVHVFAKGVDKTGLVWKPTNVTTTFTQEDKYVYAFTSATYSQTNFTWVWYDPSGRSYKTDSASFNCRITRPCDFYDRQAIAGTDAATKLGTWRMDLLADGVLAYSDSFQLIEYIKNEASWVFDVDAAMHAHVAVTATIHPYQGQQTNQTFRFRLDTKASNFTAREHGTDKALGVISSTEGSQNRVRVIFVAPQGDGYRFVLSFDISGAFGTRGSSTFLIWSYGEGVNPLPNNVTVLLPPSFALTGVEGASDYHSKTTDGRTVVSFSGTAPPNGTFDWSVFYAPAVQSTTSSLSSTTSYTSQSSAPSPLQGIPGFPIEAILLGMVLAGLITVISRRRQIRHRV